MILGWKCDEYLPFSLEPDPQVEEAPTFDYCPWMGSSYTTG